MLLTSTVLFLPVPFSLVLTQLYDVLIPHGSRLNYFYPSRTPPLLPNMDGKSAIEIISTPINLPCSFKLPNRLVKCPMQETLAEPPLFDPPVSKWHIYKEWAHASYSLLITGQVQVDIRFLSMEDDVVCHDMAPQEPHFTK
jgi:hypothetical protein